MMNHRLIATVSLFTLFCLLGAPSALAQTKPAKISPTLVSASTDPKLKEQILSDLTLAANVTFSKTSAMHQKIFGAKPSYLAWFTTRIKRISAGSCMGVETAVACVILFEPDKMRVTKNYVEMSAPQVARMSVLFHEAKHTEYNAPEKEGDPDLRFWMHVKCPTPFLDEKNQERMSIWTGAPLAGVDGCDSVPDGSYGTVVILLKNIAKNSTNTSEKIRADAEIYANDQHIRVTDATAHEQLAQDQ